MLTQVRTKQKSAVMRRIYALWILKKVMSVAGAKVLAVVFLGVKAISNVSIGNVLTNAPAITDLTGNVYFYTQAFMNTQISVQLLAVLAVFTGALYGVDITIRAWRVVSARVRGVMIPIHRTVRGQ